MPEAPERDPLLKISEAAAYLSVSRRFLYMLFDSGEIERVDLARPGSVRPDVRIRLSSLTAYVDRNDRSKK